jgi:hypothetical protein
MAMTWQYNGINMARAGQTHGNNIAAITWQEHGYIVVVVGVGGKSQARTWQDRGKNMARTWHEHGKSMARACQEHGMSIAITWQEHGKSMPITWQEHGNNIAITYLACHVLAMFVP